MANRYAYVENGEIKESNVTPVHIQNRGHITSLYYEVEELPVPTPGQFQRLKETLRIEGRKVISEYVLVEKTITEILTELHISKATAPAHELYGYVIPDLLITDVDPVIVGKVLELVKKYVGQRLDGFAQERDYDSIVSLTTYATSALPKFSAEGQRGLLLRDQTFAALYGFLADMQAGEAFVPKSQGEIEALLPALTWE